MRRLTVLLLGIVSLQVTSGASDIPTEGTREDLQIHLLTSSDYVATVPFWIAAIVKNHSPADVMGPAESIFPFKGIGYRWELRALRDDRVTARRTIPCPQSVPGLGETPGGRHVQTPWPRHRIQAGESVRLLFALDGTEGIKPGKYRLSVAFLKLDGGDLGQAITSEITVREPTPVEKEALERMGPLDIPLRPLGEGHERKVFDLPKTLEPAIGFDFLVRSLLREDVRVEDVSMKSLELANAPLYEPELAVVRYEVLLAKKEKQPASDLRKSARDKWPQLNWLFEAVDQGRGPLSTGRRLMKLWR